MSESMTCLGLESPTLFKKHIRAASSKISIPSRPPAGDRKIELPAGLRPDEVYVQGLESGGPFSLVPLEVLAATLHNPRRRYSPRPQSPSLRLPETEYHDPGSPQTGLCTPLSELELLGNRNQYLQPNNCLVNLRRGLQNGDVF